MVACNQFGYPPLSVSNPRVLCPGRDTPPEELQAGLLETNLNGCALAQGNVVTGLEVLSRWAFNAETLDEFFGDLALRILSTYCNNS